MADEIIIETVSAEVVEVGVPGPQGPAGAAGTGLETLTTQGDTLYRGASTGERLPIGTTGQILRVSASGIPEWGAAPASGVSSVNSETGAVTLDGSDIDTSGNDDLAAFVTYEFADGNGIYYPLPDSTLNSKRVYRTTTGHHVFFQSLRWHITDGSPITANIIESSDDDNAAWPWLSAWDGSIEKAQLSTVVGRARSNFLFVGDSIPNTSVSGLASVAASGDYDDLSGKPTLGTSSTKDAPTTGNASSTQVVLGNDTRLSDARTPSSTLAHAASHAAGVKASYNDQVAGMTANVFIRANNVGTAGNSITLTFDGGDDIYTVLAAWNAANTSNTAEFVSGDDSQVPDDGEEITLSGGAAAGADPVFDQRLNTTNDVTFKQITLSDNVSEESYKLEADADTGLAANGFGIFSESTQSYPFVTTPEGEAIFAGTSAFLSVADRSDITDADKYKGLYGVSGCFNVYSNVLNQNIASFADNGDVLMGTTGYGEPASDGTTSSWGTKFQVNGNVAIQDNENEVKATFDAQDKLTANRTYDLPNRSGELMIVGDAPASHTHGNLTNDGKVGSTSGLPLVTTTAGAVTTLALGTAGQVLRTKSDLSGVEFADPAAAGVTSVTGTAPIVSSGGTTPAISVTVGTGANTVAAGNDSRITGAIQSTLVDAKGDLIVATAADTVARLPVGATNGHVLTVDSAEAGGMKWAAASGGLTGIASSASQVLGTSSGNITGVDGNTIDSADPFVKWNDTAARLEYANPLSRPAGAMYVGVAPTTTALGTRAINIQADRSLAATRIATGTDAVLVGNNGEATATNATAVGYRARATGTYAVAIGGEPSATANYSIAIGEAAAANAVAAINISNYSAYFGNTSSGVNSVGLNASPSLRGEFATAAMRAVYWGGQTTSDTANVELNLDATATNRMTIAANTAVIADIYLIARRTDNSKFLAARRWVAIRRDGSNNTALIGGVQTIETDQSEGSPTWTFTIDADDTASVESLRVRVTGAASETVNWRVCAIYRVVT
jgi:trimeric autotransporter adhesin